MFNKIGQIIILIFFSLLISVLQFSFISSLPGAFSQINLGVILMIFILFFFRARSTIIFIFFFGFFMDIFSFQFFGFYLITLGAVALIAYLISKNWLTNKSLYSFGVLFLISTLVYNLIAAILAFLTSDLQSGFSVFNFSFWQALFYQLVWNILAAILFFNILTLLAKRFKPFFLEKKGRI
ncbi:MAG: hypothetical protein WCT50_00500 [Patescibacteria group bacterium]|jgi:cell shape-determining protein MreD